MSPTLGNGCREAVGRGIVELIYRLGLRVLVLRAWSFGLKAWGLKIEASGYLQDRV